MKSETGKNEDISTDLGLDFAKDVDLEPICSRAVPALFMHLQHICMVRLLGSPVINQRLVIG